MEHIVSKILLYDLPENSILMELCGICEDLRTDSQPKDRLVAKVYKQVKRLLIVATDYGVDKK